MFRKHHFKAKNSNSYCYVTLNDTTELYKENLCKTNYCNQDYLLRAYETMHLLDNEVELLINDPNHFSFYEILSEENNKIEKLLGRPHYTQYKHTFTLVFNMTENEIKDLIETKNSNWNGKSFVNPEKVKQIDSLLKDHLVSLHINTQNEVTKEWVEYLKLDKKEYLSLKKHHVYRIGLICSIV